MKSSPTPQVFYFNQPLARTASSSSYTSRTSTDDDEFYFSDASSSSPNTPKLTSTKGKQSSSQKCTSSCKCTKCTLGDFVFDNIDEYNEYLELINDYQSSQSEVTTPLTSPELDAPAAFKAPVATKKTHKHKHSHSHSSTVVPTVSSVSSSSSSTSSSTRRSSQVNNATSNAHTTATTKRAARPRHISLPKISSLPQPRLQSHWSDDSDSNDIDSEDETDSESNGYFSSPSEELQYTNKRWEGALEFASWKKPVQGNNEWIAPNEIATNKNLRRLVRLVQ